VTYALRVRRSAN